MFVGIGSECPGPSDLFVFTVDYIRCSSGIGISVFAVSMSASRGPVRCYSYLRFFLLRFLIMHVCINVSVYWRFSVAIVLEFIQFS